MSKIRLTPPADMLMKATMPAKDEVFQFTEYTKSFGILTKVLSCDPEGKIKKKSTQCKMKAGTARTREMNLYEFLEYLPTLKDSQAIGHGICGYDKINIVTSGAFKNKPGTIPRTKKYFHYPKGPALAMIDYDSDEGQPELSYHDVIDIIVSVCPRFAATPKVLTYSTSSCIYKDGVEIRGKGAGFHLYFLVENGEDLERFKDVLFQRLWLAGHGYIKISRSGALLPRTIFDTAVFSPERLDFVAGARLLGGLEQRRPDPIYIPGVN
jgi:hypothetical protein